MKTAKLPLEIYVYATAGDDPILLASESMPTEDDAENQPVGKYVLAERGTLEVIRRFRNVKERKATA